MLRFSSHPNARRSRPKRCQLYSLLCLLTERIPKTGSTDCCASATTGQARAPAPAIRMNSRRLIRSPRRRIPASGAKQCMPPPVVRSKRKEGGAWTPPSPRLTERDVGCLRMSRFGNDRECPDVAQNVSLPVMDDGRYRVESGLSADIAEVKRLTQLGHQR